MTARRWIVGATVALLAGVGIFSAGYVLLHERLRTPFRDVYHVNVQLGAADGVAPGLGQPVEVAGVRVGNISDARLEHGLALVTLEITRSKLAVVHRDASAALTPVTPLKDMQVELSPGSDGSPRLADGGTITAASTTAPASLSDLLHGLDLDTRDFLGSLISSVSQGTRGRAEGLRKALVSLGPTIAQAGQITAKLDRRRRGLARLVHNLAIVTRAASDNDQLASLVSSGQQVLDAVAREDAPLTRSLAQLPGTLGTVHATLAHTAQLADRIPSALTALTPATRRLPHALKVLGPFAAQTSGTLAQQVRPLVRESQPLLRSLGPAVSDFRALAPSMTTSLRVLNYTVNELAYNPPGDDEGLLFWFPWWFHNYVSMFSAQDAHGSAARATILSNCQQFTSLAGVGDILKIATGTYSLCGGGG